MCVKCNVMRRRGFLSLSAAGLVGAGLVGAGLSARTARAADAVSPDEALARLKAGNQKFINAPQLCESDMAKQRAGVAKGQAPWATILTCADSRVAPELLFGGVGLGELFVARNAGNLVDTATLGTVEYGAAVLGSPLIVLQTGMVTYFD